MNQSINTANTALRANALESVVRALLLTLDKNQSSELLKNLTSTWDGLEAKAPDKIKEQIKVTREIAFEIVRVSAMRSEG